MVFDPHAASCLAGSSLRRTSRNATHATHAVLQVRHAVHTPCEPGSPKKNGSQIPRSVPSMASFLSFT
eukprot:s744_g3.t1